MTRTHRAALRTLAGIGLATTTILAGSVAFADGTPPAPTVTIVSPAQQDSVTGSVQVTVAIKAPAGDPVTSVDVRVAQQPGSTPTLTVPIAPGECDSSCTKTFTIDTTRTQPTIPGALDSAAYADGGLDVSVFAHTAQATGRADDLFWLDNHLPFLSSGQNHVGGRTLHLRATAIPSPSAAAGTGISDVELIVPGTALTAPVHLTPTGDGRTWQADVDTSALSIGNHAAELVAVDSAGRVSAATPTNLAVEHGFTLTPIGGSPFVQGDSPYFAVHYTGWNTCPSTVAPLTVPEHLTVTVDGKPWHTEDLPAGLAAKCVVMWDGTNWPLPAGHHTLTATLTDADGYSADSTEPITVLLPLKVSAPATTLAAGAVYQPRITVSSPDGISHLQSWSFTLGNTVLARGHYPALPTLRWTTPNGHLLHGNVVLTTTTDYGLTERTNLSLDTRWATRAEITMPRGEVVYRSQWAYFHVGAWQHVGTNWSRLRTGNLLVQWRPATGGTWHTLTNPVELYAGDPAFDAAKRLYRNTCFRVVTSDLPATYLNSVSAPICVTVH